LTENMLKDLLMDKYGPFVPEQLKGGYTNETFLLHGTNPLLVAKVTKGISDDFQNEINCLTLTEHLVSTPKFYDLFKVNDYHIAILEFREGINGQSIIDKNDMIQAKELYKYLGKSLAAQIHSVKYDDKINGLPKCNLNEIILEADFVPKNLIELSSEILRNVYDSKEEWVLTHGDYGVHNVLFDANQNLTILDWEWGEWANPLADISWVCWFTNLHYPNEADTLIPIFLTEYLKHNCVPLSVELLKGYCVYRVWKVIHRVRNASGETQAEWTRRLQWTIETDIFYKFAKKSANLIV
jgi:thiamine kinase-like enzyme